MTIDKNFTGSGRHRRKRADAGPATGSFIPGDLTNDFTGNLILPSHNGTEFASESTTFIPAAEANPTTYTEELTVEGEIPMDEDLVSLKNPTDQIIINSPTTLEIPLTLDSEVQIPLSDDESSNTDQLLIVTSQDAEQNNNATYTTSLEDFLDTPVETDTQPSPPSPLSETGRHRIIQQNTKRGIAAWPIVTGIFVIIIVISLIAWRLVSNHLSNKRIHELALCPEVKNSVVYASPLLANSLGKLITEFNATNPRQGDYCYSFSLNVLDSHRALNYLSSPTIKSNKPVLWIPESSLYTSALKAKNPQLALGQTISIASSPVVLASQPLPGNPLTKLQWSDLPTAQKPQGLAPFGVNSWYSLKLALPRGYNFTATDLMIAAIAASETTNNFSIAPSLNQRIMVGNRLNPRVFASIRGLFSGSPRLNVRPYTSWQILNLLAHQDPEKVNELHAVPVLEEQLFQYVARYPDARLTEIIPKGFPIVADFPAQVIADSNTDQEALSSFIDFALKNTAFHQALARLGLRDPQYIQHFSDQLGLGNTILNLNPIIPPVFPATANPQASNAILQAIRYS